MQQSVQQVPHDFEELGPLYIATANLFALSTQVTYTRWFGMMAIIIPLMVAALVTDSGWMRWALALASFVVAVFAWVLLYHNSIFQDLRRKMGEELEAAMTGETSGHLTKIPRSFRAQRVLFGDHKRIDANTENRYPPAGRWGGFKLLVAHLPHQADLITAGLVAVGTLAFFLVALLWWPADEPPVSQETQLVVLLEQYRLADEDRRQLELTRLLTFCDDRVDRSDELGTVCSSISAPPVEALDESQVTLLLRELLE